LRGRRAEIAAAGADLVLVGNGSAEQARRFQTKVAPDVPVYTDPARRSYGALGLKRSVRATLGPTSAAAFVGATLRGHRQTSLAGDPWQQGGLLLLARGGRVLFLQRNRGAGERPDVEGALAALKPAGSRRPARDRSALG
jgi:hypothetical protein